MARHQDYKTSRSKRCPDRIPDTRARAETGTEHQVDVDSARGASTHTAATNATAANILEAPAPTEHQKTLQQQRQEWADFLAEVAAEAAANQHNRRPSRHHERTKNQAKWSRTKYKTQKVLGSFSIRLQYINTHDNRWADALSRGDPEVFT